MNRRAFAVSALALAACVFAAADAPGVDLVGMDKSVKPGDDFFAYANGGWLKGAEIPADRSTWGGNAILANTVEKEVADLIKGAAASKPKAGTEAAKIADYYTAYMDEFGIETKSLMPVKPELAKINAIKDLKSLSTYLGSITRADVDVMNNTKYATDNLYGVWVAADFDKPTTYSAFLLQGGLSLPNREFYLGDSAHTVEVRDAFKAHIAKVLQLANVSDAQAKAGRIFDLESKIAHVHASVTDTSDPEKGNNHWARADLDTKAKGMDWAAFLTAANLSSQKSFVVWQPAAFTGESALVASIPVETWKEYLTFHYIDRNSGVLPKVFVDERFNFY
jgi:putative endopeptidase